jgi:hypothetical protein
MSLAINNLNCGQALRLAGTITRAIAPTVLKLAAKVTAAGLPSWMVYKLRTSVVVPKVELSWCQVGEKAFTASCQKKAFDAEKMREKGKAALARFGTSLPELNAQVSRSSNAGTTYANQGNTTVEGYVEHQLNNGYFDRFDMKTLGTVLGDKPDLNAERARKLYNKLAAQTKVVLNSNVVADKDCLVHAAISSETRSNAMSYVRSRLSNRGRAEMAAMRDECAYGTAVPDAEYMFGRKAKASKQETCDAMIKSSQKTNWFYNLAANFWPCD